MARWLVPAAKVVLGRIGRRMALRKSPAFTTAARVARQVPAKASERCWRTISAGAGISAQKRAGVEIRYGDTLPPRIVARRPRRCATGPENDRPPRASRRRRGAAVRRGRQGGLSQMRTPPFSRRASPHPRPPAPPFVRRLGNETPLFDAPGFPGMSAWLRPLDTECPIHTDARAAAADGLSWPALQPLTPAKWPLAPSPCEKQRKLNGALSGSPPLRFRCFSGPMTGRMTFSRGACSI